MSSIFASSKIFLTKLEERWKVIIIEEPLINKDGSLPRSLVVVVVHSRVIAIIPCWRTKSTLKLNK